jgi:hypothetical protein
MTRQDVKDDIGRMGATGEGFAAGCLGGMRQKNASEPFKYAPLKEIDKYLRPLLLAEEEMDLSYSEEPAEGGGIRIRGRLKHLPGGYMRIPSCRRREGPHPEKARLHQDRQE